MTLFKKVKDAILRLIKRACKSKTIDNLEKMIIITAINTGLTSATNGSVKLPAKTVDDIASAIVEGLNNVSGKLTENIK